MSMKTAKAGQRLVNVILTQNICLLVVVEVAMFANLSTSKCIISNTYTYHTLTSYDIIIIAVKSNLEKFSMLRELNWCLYHVSF